MVSAHGVKPILSDPVDCVSGERPSVNEVANGENPIPRWVELHAIHLAAQFIKAPVNVTDHEIAARLVPFKSLDKTHATAL
jgi:hypothetical protein